MMGFHPFLQAMKFLRVSRGIVLLFSRTFGTRWGGGQPHVSAASTPGKDTASIVQEAGWAPGPVWTGGKYRPYRDSIPDRPARSSVAIPTELPGPLILYYNAFFLPVALRPSAGHGLLILEVSRSHTTTRHIR